MKEILTMSYRETERLKVISRIEHEEMTIVDAAECLHISERHMYRILRRYHAKGESGLLHRLRGQASNAGFPESIRKRTLRLYREQFSDYGPTLFSEKLEEKYDIHISHQTATRWLIHAGLWSGARKKRPHRKKRERRNAIGSLIQFDGSDHAWFEDRGKPCCLLVAIDDASNRIFARFAPVEDTASVLSFWYEYVERFGIPAEVYTDFGSVYHDNNGKQRLTQYGRALDVLGVKCIYAHSPQAKGRVERANRTLQDRLLKALRENNISTIEAANRFLDATFLDDFNKRFAHTNDLTDIHRCASGIDLVNIFCFEETRHVYNDWTLTLNAHFIQLLTSDVPLPPPRSKVCVRQWLDGSLHIFWNDNELKFVKLTQKPEHKKRTSKLPAANHPWRKKLIGKFPNQKKGLASLNFKPYRKPSTSGTVARRRRKDGTRVASGVFPSGNTSP